MKKLSLLIFLLASTHCIGQNNSGNESDYRCVIKLNDGQKLVGDFHSAGDTVVNFRKNNPMVSAQQQGEHLLSLPVNSISEIKFRNKNKLLIASVCGFAGGLLIGIIAAEAAHPDYGLDGVLDTEPQPPSDIALRGKETITLVGLGCGVLAGVLIGTANVVIPLHGDKKKYRERKSELVRYSLMQK